MERRSYKRAAALLLSVCLLFGAFSVSAVEPGNYTDITNHWAYEDMAWTLEKELFLGVTPQSFQP
ncbi:MAG: S-layer homology domain-containing protein, partial [Clostridiales bacterium]|nr:S-layer homology domain-containing protein [Clostridiales bacterium]